MKQQFTDKEAAALVNCAAVLAETTATDKKGPQPIAIACLIPNLDVVAVPAATRLMDGAKGLSMTWAINKAWTVLAYKADTKKHADRIKNGLWTEADMILQQGSIPQFCPWDGGIMVMDKDGKLLCALGAAGRTSEGDRRMMILAAHKMGYRTNFNKKGEPPA